MKLVGDQNCVGGEKMGSNEADRRPNLRRLRKNGLQWSLLATKFARAEKKWAPMTTIGDQNFAGGTKMGSNEAYWRPNLRGRR